MNNTLPLLHLVDDDERFRLALAGLLRAMGHTVREYASAAEFLAAAQAGPGCLILDVRMPDGSGLELQAEMQRRGLTLPIVFLTGHGDIAMSVQAMRAGAEDFLTKPVSRAALAEAIDRALMRDHRQREASSARQAQSHKLELLTPREREVVQLLLAGHLNKQIAYTLGITERTVKAHRASIMHKLGIRNLAELARLWETRA